MGDAMIRVKNLKKNFGDLEVLKDISFEVLSGQVCVIIGPSGSGKSTLLRCLNQLERADSGYIEICDRVLMQNAAADAGTDGATGAVGQLCKPAEARAIQLNMGLVFQNFNLFPHLSILENLIEAPVHVCKIPKADAIRTAEQLLEKFGLADKRDVYPGQLSGGQQQRVSIARALALNPKILCFDEPTSALDPELTGEVLKVIRQLADEHMTMLIVTHEMRFAENVADHVIFMDDGHIVEQGSPEAIFKDATHDRTRQFLQKIVIQ